MATEVRRDFVPYAIAVLATAAAVALRWLLDQWLGDALPLVTLFAAVAIAVWFGGHRPAIVAVVLGWLACDYLFVPPRGAFGPRDVGALVGLVAFLFSSGVIIAFGEALRVGRRRAREGQELLRVTLASIGDAIITTDADGKVTFLNAVAEHLTGWTRDEAIEKPLETVFKIINEHTRAPVDNPVQMVLKRGQVVGLANHTALIDRAGVERPIDDSAAPIRDEDNRVTGVVLIFRDVTDRRSAEHASQRLAAIVESSDDAIVAKDLAGIVTSWNRAAQRVFGYTSEEMVGQPVSVLIPAESLDEERGILERVRRGTRVEPYETVRRRKDGTLVPISLTVSPILNREGRVVGASKIARDISERKRQEAELRRAGDTLRQITDALPVLISLIDAKAHYRLNNRTYEEWFQRPRTEVTGRHMREVLGDAAWAVIGPKVEAALAGQTVHYEAEVDYKGAGRKWINATYTPQFDSDGSVVGAAVLVLDITERKRVEQALRRWEHIFERAGWPVAVVNAKENTLTMVNPAYAAMHGYHVSELIGTPLINMLAPESRSELPAHVEAVNLKGDHIYESTHIRKDGSVFPCLTHVTAFKDAAGNVDYRAATLQDLSAIKSAERELRQADRRKDEFLATLAHELRNPLAPIRNAVEVLKTKTELDPHRMWGRDVIDRQVGIMARLIDDLLDVSRISRNRLELRKQRVTLAAILDSAVETSEPAIEAGKHELTLTLPPEPVYLDADPVRLAQVFSNLLNNAAKFSNPGGRIQLAAVVNSGEVHVSVTDQGVGIAADMLPRLFELFSQGPSSEQTEGGLGIGLALARGLVELHGGSIAARSEGPGRGSELTVRLPLSRDTPRPPVSDARGRPSTRSSPSHRILIVDDHKDSADSLAMMLQLMGHKVDVAYDGEEGVRAAERLRPNVVLLDIGMPKLNGHEACRRIREQPWGREVSIIALTGWGQREDRRRTEQAGFDHHLVKPVEPAELQELLASFE